MPLRLLPFLTLVLAVAIGTLFPVPVTVFEDGLVSFRPEIEARTRLGYQDLVLALASGAAG